jgi:transcriptional regulator with XRE-family HTH domain
MTRVTDGGLVVATDTEVAEAMGVDKAAVSRVVNGTRRPGRIFMDKAAEALGWSLRRQYVALADGKYAEQFRRHINAWKPPDAA